MRGAHLSTNRRLVVACACWLAASAVGSADELDDRLKIFRDAIAPHLKALETDPEAANAEPDLATRKRMQAAMVAQALAGLAAQAESADPQNLARQIEELRRYPDMPAELKPLLDALARDLPKLAEQRAERRAAEVDGLVKRVAPACLSAKTEADLDPLLRELGRMTRGARGEMFGGEIEQRDQRRLQGAVHTVSTWQDYLAHLALGHTAGATAALKRLLEDSTYPIIARAEIEQRLITPPPAGAPREDRLAILARVERIEDLEKALAEMRRTDAADGDPNGRVILQQIDQIVTGYSALQAGFYADAFRIATGSTRATGFSILSPWMTQIIRLDGLLLLKVLPPYLGLREISPPNGGETGSDYLMRLLGELLPQRRFRDMGRVLETYRTVAFDNPAQEAPWIAADLEGLRAFAVADRFAQAELWAEAINGFRRAAASAGRFTPAEEAAQRLAELSRKYPEQVQAAAQSAETEAIYQRLSRDAASAAARAVQSQMPPELRGRMERYQPGFPR